MSKANPRKAVRAILPEPIGAAGGACVVRPLTLATFAVLERIKSPLLGENPADGSLSLVPSLYALTHDPMESLSGDLFAKSVAWADALPPSALVEIRAACERQVRAMLDVVPELPKAAEKKKRATDGSQSSPSGPAAPTAGAGARSCSKSPRARSRSSGVSAEPPKARTTPSRSR